MTIHRKLLFVLVFVAQVTRIFPVLFSGNVTTGDSIKLLGSFVFAATDPTRFDDSPIVKVAVDGLHYSSLSVLFFYATSQDHELVDLLSAKQTCVEYTAAANVIMNVSGNKNQSQIEFQLSAANEDATTIYTFLANCEVCKVDQGENCDTIDGPLRNIKTVYEATNPLYKPFQHISYDEVNAVYFAIFGLVTSAFLLFIHVYSIIKMRSMKMLHHTTILLLVCVVIQVSGYFFTSLLYGTISTTGATALMHGDYFPIALYGSVPLSITVAIIISLPAKWHIFTALLISITLWCVTFSMCTYLRTNFTILISLFLY